MKIGDIASYTYIQKKIMVNKRCIYEHCEAVTKEGMIVAINGETAYFRSENETIKVSVSQLIKR